MANASSDHKLRSLISKSSDAQAVLRLVARAANPDLRVHAMFQLAKLAGARAQQRPNAEGQGGDREPWASSPQWRALVTALEQDCCRREGLSARQLSKAFWAAGKLGNALPLKEQGQGPALVQLLEAKVQQLGQELDGQGCSNVWWAMATLSANSGTSSRAWEGEQTPCWHQQYPPSEKGAGAHDPATIACCRLPVEPST